MKARCQRTMKVFLQDKGHHQTATGMQMTIAQSISAVRCPPLPPINTASASPGYGHWRFAGENIDIAAGKARRRFSSSSRSGRITLDSRHRNEAKPQRQFQLRRFRSRPDVNQVTGAVELRFTVPARTASGHWHVLAAEKLISFIQITTASFHSRR